MSLMRGAGLSIVIALAACSAAPPTNSPTAAPSTPTPAPAAPPVAPVSPQPAPIITAPRINTTCTGALKQGGLILCQTEPGATVSLNGVSQIADASGAVQFGIATDAPASLTWSDSAKSGTLTIAPRTDDYSEIPGFDCDKVEARTDAQIAHADRSRVVKNAAFATFHPGVGAARGFTAPAKAPPSSPFGRTRKYIGVSKVTGQPCESESVHRGYDLAAPMGTVVVAPADGIVTLADPDLYYEGGAIFLDHGQGLVSIFMHLSSVDVKAGDVVKRGAPLAKSGNTGRTTGPHLHWAVKWRNASTTSRDGDFYLDPALLLQLPVTPTP